MTTPKELEAIPTRVAWTGWDDHKFRGHWVFAELAGSESYTGLLALAVTGRRLTREQCAMLDDAAACATLAEPRIWSMKATRLAAAYDGELAACCVGILCQNGDHVGPWAVCRAALDLAAMRADLPDGPPDREAVRRAIDGRFPERARIVGFGVPYREYDERFRSLTTRVEARGRAQLPHWALWAAVVEIVRSERGIEPNIIGGLAAVYLDLGFTPGEIGPLVVALMQHLIWANAVEGARQAPAVLRRLPDDRVEYVGAPPRVSPRSARVRRSG